MLPHLTGEGANPSSPHGPGRRARLALDEAHERLARSIGAEARAIVFTGGGTEAVNLAVKGAAWARKATGHRIVTTAVEHKAVLESCLLLEKFGFEIVVLPVDRYGRVDPDELTRALTDTTILVSLQLANNEVGTLQPVSRARRARARRRRARSSTSTPSGPRRSCPSTSGRSGRTSSRWPPTRSRDPPASGRCGSAAAPPSCPRSTVAARSATGGRARRTSPARWAWPSPSSWPPPSGPSSCRSSRRGAIACARPSWPIDDVELTGHPVERLPGSLSVIVRGLVGDELVMALDLDGPGLLDGLGLHDRLDRAVARPHGDGLPAVGGARARCASRSGAARSDEDVDAAARDRARGHRAPARGPRRPASALGRRTGPGRGA